MRTGAELRAPQHVTLGIQHWMIRRQMSAGRRYRNAPSNVKYFFAGFEHRERQQFRPAESKAFAGKFWDEDQLLYVTDIEAGISGGRWTEVSVGLAPRNLRKTRNTTASDTDGYSEDEDGTELLYQTSQVDDKASRAVAGAKTDNFVKTAFSLVELVDGIHRGKIGAMLQNRSSARQAGSSDAVDGSPEERQSSVMSSDDPTTRDNVDGTGVEDEQRSVPGQAYLKSTTG